MIATEKTEARDVQPGQHNRPRSRGGIGRGWRWRVRLADGFNVGLVLLAVNLFARNLGPISPEWSRAAGVLCLWLLVFFNLCFPLRVRSWNRVLVGGFTWGVALTCIVHVRGAALSLALVPAALWSIHLLLRGLNGRLRRSGVCVSGALLYAATTVVTSSVPMLGDWLTRCALSWSHIVGEKLLGQPLFLGPSGLGGGIFASAVCFLVVDGLRSWKRRALKRLLWAAAALVGANVLYIWMQNQPEIFPQFALPLFYSQAAFLALAVVLMALVFRPGAPGASRPVSRGTWLIPACVVALGALAVVSWPLVKSAGGKRIFFYEGGFLDWNRPVFGKYGGYESGMFGCLPDYLSEDGFSAQFGRGLTTNQLAGADVLVIINPTNQWSSGELEAVWGFVKSGGSLLVLGDHTDIMGSQSVLDRLLAPINTRFNFDAGFPAREEWAHCLRFLEHPMNERVDGAPEAMISVGASLDIGAPAFSVGMGRYGFGDLGNRLNVQGAFLGDYRYEKGEQFGDVVLVAAAFFGRGKALVFGDTSSFQNGALPFSYRTFVQPIFHWLTTRDFPGLLWWKTLAGFLMLAAVLFSLRCATGAQVAMLSIVLTLAVATGGWSNRREVPPSSPSKLAALLDRTHGNQVTLAPLERESIGPLTATLQRCKLLPYVFNEWSETQLRQARLFVCTAPTRRYTPRELRELKQFVEAGGVLMMNCGWEEKGSAMQGLLDTFGLDVLRIPLGPVPVNRTVTHLANEPQFINAWPVAVQDTAAQGEFEAARARYRPPVMDQVQARRLDSVMRNLVAPDAVESAQTEQPPARPALEVLYQTEAGLPLVLARRIGRGAVVLAGDTYFLGHDNLESLHFYRQGNILFLRYILERVGGMGG